MVKPYKQVEVTEAFVVYECRTMYLYVMYGILASVAVGYFANIPVLLVSGGILMILHLLLVSTQYMKLGRITKRAAQTTSVEISGSKWSFAKPLRIKISTDPT